MRSTICSSKDRQFQAQFEAREETFFRAAIDDFVNFRNLSEERNNYVQKSLTEKYEQLDMPSIGECPVCMEKQYMYGDIVLCDGKLAVQHGICTDCYYKLPDNRCPICRTPSSWDSATLSNETSVEVQDNILKTIKFGTLQESFFHCSI